MAKIKILSGARKRFNDQVLTEIRAYLLKELEGIPQEEWPRWRQDYQKGIEELGAKWEAEDAKARACKTKIIPFRGVTEQTK